MVTIPGFASRIRPPSDRRPTSSRHNGRMDVSLRPGESTVADGLAFARLLDEAQEGWFRAALGRRAAELVATAYQRTNNELSYENVSFAESEGLVVGMGVGYTAITQRDFNNALMEVSGGWRGYRLKILSRITARVLDFLATIPEGDFYVRALAVDAGHRGRGVGTRLLDCLEQRARTTGSDRLALDVAARNREARQLYERFGMSAEAESRRWFRLPNTNLIRMVKPL